ncbi:DUF934 domain-containing protein [Endozoicomonas numazuensis]|uniref:Oxidoreductase n=1 Tax=Endozoicomonas numazuensis TaxID=1137799 RepID=A0A081N9F2_9GAMM|nr:DUF934 domain-containing protein [Endozoicomonas numazuensis]KEQ15075.1 hypothetical protein GZ78_24730 [Endozoicomonas numazuensis]
MARLLKNNEVFQEEYQVLGSEDVESTSGTVLVQAKHLDQHLQRLQQHDQPIGLFLDSDDELEAYEEQLSNFELIAINFPKFMDGRGYSLSKLLRDRYQFKGDIRAVGDVLVDQIFMMKRCGFSSYYLRDDQKAEDAIKALDTFTLRYQGSSDDPEPLYRKRA